MPNFLYSFLLLLTFCTSKKDSVSMKPSYVMGQTVNKQSANFKVMVTSDNNSAPFNAFLKKNNIQKVGFVGDGQFLDPKIKFAFNQKMLDQEILRAYPNQAEEGIGYIDLEAPYLDYLMNSDLNSDNFKRSKKLFLNVLAYVQKARPNVKWGFYHIPETTYWGKTDSFYQKDERISDLIKNSDVLFPSIYIFYNKVNFILENESYLTKNAEEIIRIGQKYNKKVYPLIMSRYHPSSGSIAYETIKETDFRFYFSTIRNTRYNGKAVDGILLWNADKYFYKTNEINVKQEVQKSKLNFDNYYDNYLINILSIMSEKK